MSSSRRGSTLIGRAARGRVRGARRPGIDRDAGQQAARQRQRQRAHHHRPRQFHLSSSEHLAEVLVEGLELQVLEVGELGDRLGLLVLEAPGDVDDADVRADHQVVELVGDLGEHRLGQAAAERLRLVEHRAELVAGRRQLFLLGRQVPGHGRQPDGGLPVDALVEGRRAALCTASQRERTSFIRSTWARSVPLKRTAACRSMSSS